MIKNTPFSLSLAHCPLLYKFKHYRKLFGENSRFSIFYTLAKDIRVSVFVCAFTSILSPCSFSHFNFFFSRLLPHNKNRRFENYFMSPLSLFFPPNNCQQPAWRWLNWGKRKTREMWKGEAGDGRWREFFLRFSLQHSINLFSTEQSTHPSSSC